MKMRKHFMIFSILVAAIVANAQNRGGSSDVDNHPTIAVVFECREGKKIRLRLYNKTEWAIALQTFSYYVNPDPKKNKVITLRQGGSVFGLPNDREISSLFYFIEKVEVRKGKKILLTESNAIDSYNSSWIAPNDSIFFLVPAEWVDEQSELYIKFNYEWELSKQSIFLSNEPQHRLYFRSAQNEENIKCSQRITPTKSQD